MYFNFLTKTNMKNTINKMKGLLSAIVNIVIYATMLGSLGVIAFVSCGLNY